MNALLVAAAFTWAEIVVPGVTIGQAFGINEKGQVTVTSADGNASGIYQHGTFTPLPAPPAGYQVSAIGINNAGVITGVASTASDPAHTKGFILSGGVYTFFSRPGWNNTFARAIGRSSLITGFSQQDTGETAGFLYDPATGVFTDVTPPRSTFTIVQGINQLGRISGNGRETGGRYAFVWQQGPLAIGKKVLQPFLERILVADVNSNARGINDFGTIVGFTISGGTTVGYFGNAVRGYQLLVPPGGDSAGAATYCEGINNFHQVVCHVQVSDPITGDLIATRAFIGTPKNLLDP
jgi:hypothetical protein